jgi:SNF2 family DNA or RNA helicase
MSSSTASENPLNNLLLAYFKHHLSIASLYLMVVPRSTLRNWVHEFKQWTSDISIVVLTRNKEECADVIVNRLILQDLEACITSYEMPHREIHVQEI